MHRGVDEYDDVLAVAGDADRGGEVEIGDEGGWVSLVGMASVRAAFPGGMSGRVGPRRFI